MCAMKIIKLLLKIWVTIILSKTIHKRKIVYHKLIEASMDTST